MLTAEYKKNENIVIINSNDFNFEFSIPFTNDRNTHRLTKLKLHEMGFYPKKLIIKHHNPPGYQTEFITTSSNMIIMPTDYLTT